MEARLAIPEVFFSHFQWESTENKPICENTNKFFFLNLIGSSGITNPNTNLSYAMLCYAQYLSNSTLVSCVAYGGAMQFQFPWIDSFSGLGPFFKSLTLKNPA